MAALSGSYQVQSSASKRQLKADIEEQGITNYERFLSAAEAVIVVRASACISALPIHNLTSYMLLQALEEVQSELNALSTGCSAINTALAADRTSSADLISESDKLQHELATSQKRSTLVHSFFKQYQLSATEIAALQVLCCKPNTCRTDNTELQAILETLSCSLQDSVCLSSACECGM